MGALLAAIIRAFGSLACLGDSKMKGVSAAPGVRFWVRRARKLLKHRCGAACTRSGNKAVTGQWVGEGHVCGIVGGD